MGAKIMKRYFWYGAAYALMFGIACFLAGLALAPSALPMLRFACMPEYRDGPILNLNSP